VHDDEVRDRDLDLALAEIMLAPQWKAMLTALRGTDMVSLERFAQAAGQTLPRLTGLLTDLSGSETPSRFGLDKELPRSENLTRMFSGSSERQRVPVFDRTAKISEVYGRVVAYRRHQAGHTGAELAEMASLSTTALRNIENGVSSASFEIQRRLAEALGTTADQLIRDFDHAVEYLRSRGTWLFEVAPDEAKPTGRLKARPEDRAVFAKRPLLVCSKALYKEVEAALEGRVDLPRTPDDEAERALAALQGSAMRSRRVVGREAAELAVDALDALKDQISKSEEVETQVDVYRPDDGSSIGEGLAVMNVLLNSGPGERRRVLVLFDEEVSLSRASLGGTPLPAPGDTVAVDKTPSGGSLSADSLQVLAQALVDGENKQ